jgi:alpha-L-arabinofuranosidase
LRDAVLAALNLNIFARHTDRVRMDNIAQMDQRTPGHDPHRQGKMVLAPTYYVYKMYVPFHDAALLTVAFDAGTYKHEEITLPRVS